MESMTISQVSKQLGISTRMLRYYEKEGLIQSSRREDYSYRVYEETAINRLKQILLLRKLRIPVRQIRTILKNSNAVDIIEIFQQNQNDLDEEITALTSIKDIMDYFVQALSNAADLPLHKLMMEDNAILASIEALGLIGINFKEGQYQTMENLKKADQQLTKLKDVRIIYLPPSWVAASHYIGDDPETHANDQIDTFVREHNLHKVKKDLRHYGFNHPNPVDETGYHGYETWVTIPEDMEVPQPLVKKYFPGGLYAAHMIAFGNFNEWESLMNWIAQSEKYEFAGDYSDQEHMCGLLDEHLNYIGHVELANTEPEDFQLDLLMPVREKEQQNRQKE